MSNGSNQRYPGGYGGYGSGPGRDQGSGSEWWRDKDGDDMGEEMRFGEYGDEGESREQYGGREQYGRGQSGRGQSGGQYGGQYGGQRQGQGQQRYGQGQGQGQQRFENERERWRDEWGAGRGGGDRSRSGGGGSSYEQQSSPRYRGGGQGRYDPTDMGGARNPYSSGYAGYDPSGGGVERYGMYGVRDTGRDDGRMGQSSGESSIQGYGGQQYGGYGREQGRGGGGGDTWRDLEARERLRRGNEAGYGGGYYGSSSSGGQSYSGGQRTYPGDPGYRQSGTSGYGGSSGQGGRGYGLESYESGGRGRSQYQSGYGSQSGSQYGSQYGQGQQYGGQQSQQYGQQGQQYGQQQRRRRVGPKGYQRSDERIREDLCERLSDVPMVDVSQVSVEVSGGAVTLTGTVRERHEKFVIEDIADEIFGVQEVHNQIRVTRDSMGSAGAGSEAGGDYRSSGGGMSGTLGSSGTSGSSGSTSATSTGSPLSSGTMGTSGTTGSTGTMGTSGTTGTAGTTGASGSSVSSASGSTPDIGDGLGSTGKGTNR
ncbi:transporter [Cupriavidus sp. HPC(L)]|uniref:BON domain-containing protein n=1 Tax=Cupriavidus sp. HPC(L) TaxID=1217418 RepID=UPI0002917AF5|nr:BON domain-containing protein [Cupriavidus sp. HPC(L)]ESJ23640.1 transporter [Cupriavidus sp. HPC(L)]